MVQVAVATVVVAVGLTVGVRGASDPTPVLPDTTLAFSLDLEVVGSVDADTVYVVEQRARPGYRIFSFEPASGDVETVFTVPEDAIIHGMSLSPDGADALMTRRCPWSRWD